jgi:FKBP-type peptidyl-prolyl cis-trans isomerase FkpA
MQIKNLFVALGMGVIIAGCNNVDFKKTKSGLPYKLYPSKNGKKVEEGKFVKAQVTQKIKDSLVFSTYNSLPLYFQVNPAQQTYDISEVFTSLKEGDSVYSEQMMDTFIKRNPAILQQTAYKNGDKIVTTMKILKVYNSPEDFKKDEEQERMGLVKKEEEAVKGYLSKNKINAQRTGTGTYVQIMEPGTGEPVAAGKYVSVMYKGQTFGGKVFDSNMDPAFGHTDPMGFMVGMGQMIRGFDEGVQLLKEGGKCRIFIPSTLGYGAQPPSPDIKPFEHLIFDVQIVDVADKAPAERMMPPTNIDTTQRRS